jgi:hypothetical protein
MAHNPYSVETPSREALRTEVRFSDSMLNFEEKKRVLSDEELAEQLAREQAQETNPTPETDAAA